MRLYLSSFRLGNHPEEMAKLTRGKRAVVIANAADMKAPNERKDAVKYEIDCLDGLGFNVDEIDLRDYFGKSDELADVIRHYDLIWVRGGNVFILLRAFKESGFDNVLERLLQGDAVTYGGYSAGVCVLQPNLKGIELVDDPYQIPSGYKPEIIWDGLGILPYSVAPHYESDHPESEAVNRVVEYMNDNGMLYKTLRDGEAIVINGDEEKVVS